MAVVPQETHLAFDYTVAEVAMMGRYPHLGAFEIEGPPISRWSRRRSRPPDAAVEGSASRRQRRRETAGRDRHGAGATLPRCKKGDSPFFANKGDNQSPARARSRAGGRIDCRLPLLDEPTASLDLGYQIEVVSLLKQLHEERRVRLSSRPTTSGSPGRCARA
jgi:iron complex transport system ATP-binding protein